MTEGIRRALTLTCLRSAIIADVPAELQRICVLLLIVAHGYLWWRVGLVENKPTLRNDALRIRRQGGLPLSGGLIAVYLPDSRQLDINDIHVRRIASATAFPSFQSDLDLPHLAEELEQDVRLGGRRNVRELVRALPRRPL